MRMLTRLCTPPVYSTTQISARLLRAVLIPLCLGTLAVAIAHPNTAWTAPLRCDPPSKYRVVKVVDGDSLKLSDGRMVRLIGVNAPDYGKERKPDEPLAREAHQLLAKLVDGRCVSLIAEADPTDRYGRVLAHVILPGGVSVEETLIKQGLAWMIAISPNVAWTAKLTAAESEARLERRGIWKLSEYKPMAAALLNHSHTGFRLIEGTVQRVGRSRYAYYFDLTTRTTLLVTRADWGRYFHGDPNHLLNRRLIARGWLSAHNERLRIRVHHPAMLTFVK